MVDSVQIELYNFKGHDFYSEVFPNISDTLAGFLQDVKSEYELRKGRKYPYQKFIMAETPISFHGYVRIGKETASKHNRRWFSFRNLPPLCPVVISNSLKKRIANWGTMIPWSDGMEEIDVE